MSYDKNLEEKVKELQEALKKNESYFKKAQKIATSWHSVDFPSETNIPWGEAQPWVEIKTTRPRNSVKDIMFHHQSDGVSRYPWNPAAKLPQLEELREILSASTDICIAGGAVLGAYAAVSYGDIDIFPFNGPESIKEAEEKLAKLGYAKKWEKEHCIGFKHDADVYREVQIVTIHNDVSNVKEVIERFDISICKVAIHLGKLIAGDLALGDISKRVIRCTGSLTIASTIQRIEKYRKRGFKVLDLEEGESLEDLVKKTVENKTGHD